MRADFLFFQNPLQHLKIVSCETKIIKSTSESVENMDNLNCLIRIFDELIKKLKLFMFSYRLKRVLVICETMRRKGK